MSDLVILAILAAIAWTAALTVWAIEAGHRIDADLDYAAAMRSLTEVYDQEVDR